jgi:hypothetical protein
MNVSQMYFIMLSMGGLRSPWLRSQVFDILNKELDGDKQIAKQQQSFIENDGRKYTS